MGPGLAQRWRIYDFVKSKIDGENALIWSEKWCDLKKKGLHRNPNGFFRSKLGNLKKKRFSGFTCWDYLVSFQWVLSRAHRPYAGPAKANGLPEVHWLPHGPPKVHGLRGHCTSLPPLLAALAISYPKNNMNIRHKDNSSAVISFVLLRYWVGLSCFFFLDSATCQEKVLFIIQQETILIKKWVHIKFGECLNILLLILMQYLMII